MNTTDMNTTDKINAILEETKQQFEIHTDINKVCAAVVPIAIERDIAFSEILPLVRQIGRDNGYFVELSDRKKNLLINISDVGHNTLTYTSMIEWSKDLSVKYNVPESFALSSLKDKFRKEGTAIPVKPQLSGWKLSALECWQENPKDTDLQDVRKHLRANDFNHSLYTQSYHELFTALVAL